MHNLHYLDLFIHLAGNCCHSPINTFQSLLVKKIHLLCSMSRALNREESKTTDQYTPVPHQNIVNECQPYRVMRLCQPFHRFDRDLRHHTLRMRSMGSRWQLPKCLIAWHEMFWLRKRLEDIVPNDVAVLLLVGRGWVEPWRTPGAMMIPHPPPQNTEHANTSTS